MLTLSGMALGAGNHISQERQDPCLQGAFRLHQEIRRYERADGAWPQSDMLVMAGYPWQGSGCSAEEERLDHTECGRPQHVRAQETLQTIWFLTEQLRNKAQSDKMTCPGWPS